MYIESQPASLHLRAAAAANSTITTNMESSKHRLHRPPAVLEHSSPSLRGMERTAPRSPPSFQSFVKRTAPLDQDKPLPPVPRVETRSSQRMVSVVTRRSSSVYSRTESQWAGTPLSWRSRDLSTSDMFLQPSVYSLSTPELTRGEESHQIQSITPWKLRTYEPLLASPSPSPSPSLAQSVRTLLTESSTASVEENTNQRGYSPLLPPSQPAAHVPMHITKVVAQSETARAAAFAGTDRPCTRMIDFMEPETAYDRIYGRSRSSAGLGDMVIAGLRSPVSSYRGSLPYGIWNDTERADSPILPTFPSTPWTDRSAADTWRRESKLSDKFFGVDDVDRAAMAPIVKTRQSIRISTEAIHEMRQHMEVGVHRLSAFENHSSNNSFCQLSFEKSYEDRGRTRTRSFHNASNPPDVPRNGPALGINNADIISEAQRLAKEYHDLLPVEEAQPVRKERHDISNGRDIKMAPQPLFYNPRQISKQRAEAYNRERNGSLLAASNHSAQRARHPSPANRHLNPSPLPRYPLKLSLVSEATRRRSTSGSIPISPPTAVEPQRITPPNPEPSQNKTSAFANITIPDSLRRLVQRQYSIDDNNRFSAFYTHTTQCIKSPDGTTPTAGKQSSQPLRHGGADVVATRAEAEAAFNSSTSMNGLTLSSEHVYEHNPKPAQTLAEHASTTAGKRSNHKHNGSDSSDASIGVAIRKPLMHVGGKMASVFHRNHNYNRLSNTPAAITTEEAYTESAPNIKASIHPRNSSAQHDAFQRVLADKSSTKLPQLVISSPIREMHNVSLPLPRIGQHGSIAGTTKEPMSPGPLTKGAGVHKEKRPSLFAHVLDVAGSARRESRADKRREELKRSIRLLPSTDLDGGAVAWHNPGTARRGGGGGAHRWF